MGEWYLIDINDLYAVDKSMTYIKLINGYLVPEYSRVELNTETNKKYGISKILVKSQDQFKRQFREMSTGLVLGSLESSEPLAINISDYKEATNDQLADYLSHMQEICSISLSRFDILRMQISSTYDFYKPVLDKVKQKIKYRMISKVTSGVKKIPEMMGYPIKDSETKEKEQMKKRLTLLKKEKEF